MMEAMKISIVKLGGSVITNKSEIEEINEENIRSLMKQLAKSNSHIVLIHGAGSFGHPIAKKYGLIDGDSEPTTEKLLAVSRTHHKVQILNSELIRIGNEEGLPLFPLAPSAFVIETKEGEYDYSRTIVNDVVKQGFIPVFYGDMILSQSRSFTVLSGDVTMHKIAFILQENGFDVKHVVYVSDVNGLYTSDPKIDPNAEMIEDVAAEEFDKYLVLASGSSSTDVTKGMYGKLIEIKEFVKRGINVSIVNVKGKQLQNCLNGLNYIGTTFRA